VAAVASAKVRAVLRPENEHKVRVYWAWGPSGARYRDKPYSWDVKDPYREAVRQCFPGATISDPVEVHKGCKEFTVTVEVAGH
jgi:hypothetical protein